MNATTILIYLFVRIPVSLYRTVADVQGVSTSTGKATTF